MAAPVQFGIAYLLSLRETSTIDKYAAAVRSLEPELPRELFETCEHGAAIDVECYQCEPVLDHDPGFDELAGDDRRHGVFPYC